MSFLQPQHPVIELGVNIDHVATLRNARGTVYPDPVQAALLAEQAGADVITLHLREADVEAIRPKLTTRMNLESAVTEEMIEIACRIRPQDVCLVPERRNEVTTEGGLDVIRHFDDIRAAIEKLARHDIRVSLFIDADNEQIKASADVGAPVIELHTGRYADTEGAAQQHEFERIRQAVAIGVTHRLKVNAGHGLHYTNVQAIAEIPDIAELNIGHAIVAHAVFVGWENAVREMKAIMIQSRLKARKS